MQGWYGSIMEMVVRMSVAGADPLDIQAAQRDRIQGKVHELVDWVNRWAEIDLLYMVFCLELTATVYRNMLTEKQQEGLQALKDMFGIALIAVPPKEDKHE